MEMSSTIASIAGALAITQATIGGAIKGKANPAFRSKYADLASVWEAWQAVGPANDLAVSQWNGAVIDGRVEITTMLMHKSGEWMRETASIPLSKLDAQGYVSAVTYGRRCGLSALAGIAPEDDDGNAAVGHRTRSEPPQEPAAPVVGPWPEGPYTAKTGLMTAYKEFVRNLHGTMDADDLEGAILDAQPMLMQFRAAARAGILRTEYEGAGEFKGVSATLAEQRARIAAGAGIPHEPGEVAGTEVNAVTMLRQTLEDCKTPADLKRWAKNNDAMIGEQTEGVRDELRNRFRERDAGMRAVDNVNAG